MKYALSLILAASAFAQTSALLPTPRQQPLNNSGDINVGGCVYTYTTGTTTPQTTYSNSTLATPNANPIVLDSSGRMPAVYWNGTAIKVVYANKALGVCPASPGTTLWSQDPVTDSGLLLKSLLAASTGAALVGFQPTGGTVPLTVAGALNSAFLYSSGYTTLALGCAAAASNNKTLAIVATIANSPAQALNCDIWFPTGTGAFIQPASGAAITMSQGRTITAADQKIFDYSAGGTVRMLLSPTAGRLKWWGAECNGSTDDALGIGYALPSTMHLILPIGKCASSTTQTITVDGQRITGQGSGYQYTSAPSALLFTGATSGLTVTSALNNLTFSDFAIATSSASGVKAISANCGGCAGWTIKNVGVLRTGAGVWTHGIHTTALESSRIEDIYCYQIAKCISVNGVSNSMDIVNPLITGTPGQTTGIEVRSSDGVRVRGGTVQGTATTANLDTDGGTTVTGTWMEGSGAHIVLCTGDLNLTDITLGGGSQSSDTISCSGADPLTIKGLKGASTPTGSLIRYDGNGAGSAQGLTVSGSYVQAVGAGAHAITVGTLATTSQWHVSITDNQLITSPGNAIVLNATGGAILISGNVVTSGAYGINATGMTDGKLAVRDNNFAGVTSGICTGCNYNNSVPGMNIQNSTTMTYFPGVFPLGGATGIGACTAARYGLSYPISDADTVVYDATVVGGGASKLNVWCDGTNWKAH